MIPVLLVADGTRDERTLPPIVARIIGRQIRYEFRSWARLHGSGRGYQKKLQFALAQARDLDVVGLVATVDADADSSGKNKLTALRKGREDDRAKQPFLPVGLGCAVPHSEAWLLDDHDAVRSVLGISATEAVPSSKDHKTTLEHLMRQRKPDSEPLELLSSLAAAVDPDRQISTDKTGYAAFVKDVRNEFADYLHPTN